MENDDILRNYIKDIYSKKRIKPEEEKELIRLAQKGDMSARNKLATAHLRFVISIAKKYHSSGLDLGDLVNEGNIGLLRAIESFDPERGVVFLSYAVWWIRQAIIKATYQKGKLIRLPLHRVAELLQIEKTKQEFSEEYAEEPDLETLSKILKMKKSDLQSLLAAAHEISSLDQVIDGEGEQGGVSSLVEALPSERETPEELCLRHDQSANINKMLKQLSSREADIIRHRFGLGNKKTSSLRVLADKYRITKERVRQLEKKALQNLATEENWQLFNAA